MLTIILNSVHAFKAMQQTIKARKAAPSCSTVTLQAYVTSAKRVYVSLRFVSPLWSAHPLDEILHRDGKNYCY